MRILVATPVLDGMPRLPAAVASVAAAAADAAPSGVSVRHVVQLSAASADGSRAWLETHRNPDVRVARKAVSTGHSDRPAVAPSQTSDFGLQTSNSELRTLDFGLQTSNFELGTLNFELRTSTDSGMYDAIGRAFSSADEDILSWLNADEQHLPGVYAAVAAAFAAHPETDVLFGDYLLLDAEGRPVAARREIPLRRWHLRHGVNANLLSCAVFFRRRVWEALGGFDPAFTRVADSEFFWRAVERGFRFRHLGVFLGAYGLTGRNLSLDETGRAEPARLRERTGAWRSPALRAVPTLCRAAEKLVRGCYLPCRVRTTLRATDCAAVAVDARLGARWKWPATPGRGETGTQRP